MDNQGSVDEPDVYFSIVLVTDKIRSEFMDALQSELETIFNGIRFFINGVHFNRVYIDEHAIRFDFYERPIRIQALNSQREHDLDLPESKKKLRFEPSEESELKFDTNLRFFNTANMAVPKDLFAEFFQFIKNFVLEKVRALSS